MLRAVRYVVPQGTIGCWVVVDEPGAGSHVPAVIGGRMAKHAASGVEPKPERRSEPVDDDRSRERRMLSARRQTRRPHIAKATALSRNGDNGHETLRIAQL